MSDPVTLAMVYASVLTIYMSIKDGKVKRDEKLESALKTLNTALEKTKAYVISINSGEPKSRDKEHELASLWHDASVPLRHIDRELARICHLKGGYWLEPETWDEARIENNQIALDNVSKKIKELY